MTVGATQILSPWRYLYSMLQHRRKDAKDNMQINNCECVPIKFYLQKLLVEWIWSVG